MTRASGRVPCITCGKEKVAYKCEGCSEHFCFIHLADHRQIITKQLDQTEEKRTLFQQTLAEQTSNIQKHSLIEQIDQWEKNSINTIEQTANEARQLVGQHATEHFRQIQIKLTEFTEELRQVQQEEDYNEIHLNELGEALDHLQEQFKHLTISVEQEMSPSFIKKIFVLNQNEQLFLPNIDTDTIWQQDGVTVVGGNGKGNGLNQLSGPRSLYVDDDRTIYVADYSNHRIVEWKKDAVSGRVVVGEEGPGDGNDRLNDPYSVIVDEKNDTLIIGDRGNRRVVLWPRQKGTTGEVLISNIDCGGLGMSNDGYLYVSDIVKQEVRRWKMGETTGTLVVGGNGVGKRLDQLNEPHFIFVDQDQSVYVSDFRNHRVIKWLKGAKEGIVVAGGQDQGNGLTQLSYPRGIVVDQLGTVYVADQSNNRVMRWLKGATEGTIVIGGNGQGVRANQFNGPFALSFDRQNSLYVIDHINHRTQKFDIDSH